MFDNDWMYGDDNGSSDILSDVFMTFSFLLMLISWQSVLLPEQVEVLEAPEQIDANIKWQQLTFNANEIRLNGKLFPSTESALSQVKPDEYVAIQMGPLSSSDRAFEVIQTVKALGLQNVYLEKEKLNGNQ